MSEDILEIDAIGLICPLPVLRLRKALEGVASGVAVRLLADDAVAVVDVPHFCAEAGHRFIEMEEAEGHQVYLVEKG